MAMVSMGGMGRTARRWSPWAVAAASGGLLWTAYPPLNQTEAAWVALAPLIGLLRCTTPRRGFGLGLVSGLAFWLPSLVWLWRLIENGGPPALVVVGHIALAVYCALYTGVFGALVASLWWGRTANSVGGELGRAALSALAWTGLELVRSTFLTGFAWNHLGVSQARNPVIVQLASVGGVYAVSALVLLLNAVVANVGVRMWRGLRGQRSARWNWDLTVALGAVVAAFLWGAHELRRWEVLEGVEPTLMVAAAQPDAPSIFERDTAAAQAVMDRLDERTARVAAFRPDVIIWPETVLPGAVPQDREAMAFAFEAAQRFDVPILAGAVEIARHPDGRELVANASWLFQPDGRVSARYRKQHLVPFGEYIPLDRSFPWLERLSPIGYSCTPGRAAALMTVPLRGGLSQPAGSEGPGAARPTAVLSPLICFEDTVAALARNAVRAGATVLVSQSNDSWFTGSSEGEQHHAQAVFRAVENRIPLVRCSNEGVTAVVGWTGQSGASSEAFATPVTPRNAAWPPTPYTRWGDWLFGWPCVAVVVVLLVRLRVLRRRAEAARLDP